MAETTQSTNGGKDAFRFVDAKSGRVTGILQTTGKLFLKDEQGGLEVFPNWRDFVRDVMAEKPVAATDPLDPKVLEQLSAGLGVSQAVVADDNVVQMKNPVKADAKAEKESKEVKKTKTAKAAPAPKGKPEEKAKAKPEKKVAVKVAAKDLPLCLCGCGEQVLSHARQFRQGHDARFHGYLKKLERGVVKIGELPKCVQEYAKANGIKPGVHS